MKKCFTTFAILISLAASAQQAAKPDQSPLPLRPTDSSAIVEAIQRIDLQSIIRREFSYILTGSNKSQVGNFASVNITQPAATFNYSGVFKSGNVLSFNGTADVKNGLAPIFNSSKLNTDVSFQPKFSFLGAAHQSITVGEGDITKYIFSYDHLTKTYNENLVTSKNQLELGFIRKKRLKAEIAQLSGQLAADPNNERLQARQMLKQDSLNQMLQYLRTTYQIDINNYKGKDDAQFLHDLGTYQDNMKQNIIKQQKTLGDQLSPPKFMLHWYAISYKISNSAFSLFNPVLAYASQVKKTNFISHSVSLEYDLYHYNQFPWRTWYLSVGADPFIGDNLNNFKTQNMEDIKTYATTPGTRNSTKTYTAYVDSGKYKSNLKGIKLHADFYYFMLNDNQLALHLNPQVAYSQGTLPEYDGGIGVLFCFKDSKDATGKAKVNTEVFCNFMDLTNSQKASGSFTGRNTIGLRFSFPINFVNP
jgi:hypothetical protein